MNHKSTVKIFDIFSRPIPLWQQLINPQEYKGIQLQYVGNIFDNSYYEANIL